MRDFRLAFPVLLALALSACAGPPLVIKKSEDPKFYGEVDFVSPPGYTHGLVLKPRGLEPPPRPAPASSSEDKAPPPAAVEKLSWNEIGDLDVWIAGGDESPSADAVTVPSAATAYNGDVSVFPLDAATGDILVYDDVYTPPLGGLALRGRLAEKVYFAHASARVGGKDKVKLRKLAVQARKDNEVEITVVGHASRRVDRVTDPVRRKMINFIMAQKRADAVTRELKKSGLKPAWVRAVSKGDEEPDTAPPAGMDQEAADRRVEVYMDEK